MSEELSLSGVGSVEEWVRKYEEALRENEALAWKGHEKLEMFKAWAGVKWGITDEEFEEEALKGMLRFGMILAEEQPDLKNEQVLSILLRLQIATIIIAVQDLAIRKAAAGLVPSDLV